MATPQLTKKEQAFVIRMLQIHLEAISREIAIARNCAQSDKAGRGDIYNLCRETAIAEMKRCNI